MRCLEEAGDVVSLVRWHTKISLLYIFLKDKKRIFASRENISLTRADTFCWVKMSFTFYLSFQRDNHHDDEDDDNEPGSKRPRQEGNLAPINQPEIQAWSGKNLAFWCQAKDMAQVVSCPGSRQCRESFTGLHLQVWKCWAIFKSFVAYCNIA